MGFELDGVIKDILYNKDGTVDYVFDNAKLDEIITPFINENDTERDRNGILFFCQAQRISKFLLSLPIRNKEEE